MQPATLVALSAIVLLQVAVVKSKLLRFVRAAFENIEEYYHDDLREMQHYCITNICLF